MRSSLAHAVDNFGSVPSSVSGVGLQFKERSKLHHLSCYPRRLAPSKGCSVSFCTRWDKTRTLCRWRVPDGLLHDRPPGVCASNNGHGRGNLSESFVYTGIGIENRLSSHFQHPIINFYTVMPCKNRRLVHETLLQGYTHNFIFAFHDFRSGEPAYLWEFPSAGGWASRRRKPHRKHR